jgi:predicted phage gp36 major capsid-like protein
MYHMVYGDGIIAGVGGELAVSGTASPLTVASGAAFVNGKFYRNTASVSVAVPTPTSATRIDRIVLRADYTAQTVRITRLAGTEGSGSPPPLTQSDFQYPNLGSWDCTVAIRRSTSMRYHWPVMSFSTKAVITGEGSAYSEAEPTFSELIFTPYKFTKLAKVSEELMADAMFDIWRDVLSPDFTQAFAAAENYYFILGSGTSQPQGILAGGSVAVTTAATNAITADELLQLYHSLHPDYRSQAVWIMNDATALYLRVLTDTTGRSLWVPSLADGTPDMLLGRPVFTASEMPTIAAGAKVIAFMVPAYYGIVSREDLAVTRLDELYATSGYVGFIGRMRWDGKVLLSDAVKLLAMKSGT